MAERMTIVDGEKISYKGLFDFKELYNLIDAYLWQKGFDKRIRKNEEHNSQESKYAHVIMQPWKRVSEYIKHEIKIDISIHHAKEEIRDVDGVKRKYTNGAISITFWGYMVTDYQGQWVTKPEYFFLRTIMDKWTYKTQHQSSASMLKNDIRLLKGELEGFLNLHRFT